MYILEMHLGDRFYQYKQVVNSLKDAVERHFGHIINQIEAGMPGIVEEEEEKEDDIFEGALNWTCLTCTTINTMATLKCQICRNNRPAFKK